MDREKLKQLNDLYSLLSEYESAYDWSKRAYHIVMEREGCYKNLDRLLSKGTIEYLNEIIRVELYNYYINTLERFEHS